MSFKSIVKRELNEMKDGIRKHWPSRSKLYIPPPDVTPPNPIEQREWANLPLELLFNIIQRVERSEKTWPARKAVVFCAAVCKSWRDVTKEIVNTPEECMKLTFPTSLKQPGPRDAFIQCYIKRKKDTSTYLLYLGEKPSEDKNDKLLLAAKRTRTVKRSDWLISLVADDFTRSSNTYVGKIRTNFLETKFTLYDSQPPNDVAVQQASSQCRRVNTKQVSLAYNSDIAIMTVELQDPGRAICLTQHYFIPVSPPEEDLQYLQFGSTGEDILTMNYRYPLSAFKAFAACVSIIELCHYGISYPLHPCKKNMLLYIFK